MLRYYFERKANPNSGRGDHFVAVLVLGERIQVSLRLSEHLDFERGLFDVDLSTAEIISYTQSIVSMRREFKSDIDVRDYGFEPATWSNDLKADVPGNALPETATKLMEEFGDNVPTVRTVLKKLQGQEALIMAARFAAAQYRPMDFINGMAQLYPLKTW
jgi:hypothetical protein